MLDLPGLDWYIDGELGRTSFTRLIDVFESMYSLPTRRTPPSACVDSGRDCHPLRGAQNLSLSPEA